MWPIAQEKNGLKTGLMIDNRLRVAVIIQDSKVRSAYRFKMTN